MFYHMSRSETAYLAASAPCCLDLVEIQHSLCAPAFGPKRNLRAEPLIEPEAHPVQFLGRQRLCEPPHGRLGIDEVGAERLLDVGPGTLGGCRFAILGGTQPFGSLDHSNVPAEQVDSA